MTKKRFKNKAGNVYPEYLAERFHYLYESLAPSFGYSTRDESSVPWDDVPSQNKALMIEVCYRLTREFSICGVGNV